MKTVTLLFCIAIVVAASDVFVNKAAAAICTPPDRTVQGIPAGLACLETYLKDPPTPRGTSDSNDRGGCPTGSPDPWEPKERSVQCKAAGASALTPHTLTHCTLQGGDAPVYSDQPTAKNNTATSGSLTPTQALRNGKMAIDQRWAYTQCNWKIKGFRIDCVGYITRAWNLASGAAYTCGSLKALANPIDCANMVPGDILLNPQHVMLFHHYDDDAKAKVTVWHASGTKHGHKEKSGVTIASLKRQKYECYRYKYMKATGPSTSTTPTTPQA